MATQPTNLPVPSESPRDLKFNAGKIDEFVTSMQREYEDRFGNKHYTIEGLRWLAQQAISAFGYITLDSFEEGNTLTLPNQVLRLEVTGEYYRWDGALPKEVPAGSTPESTGGIGTGAWISIGDAALRSDLRKNTGAELVGSPYGGTVYSDYDPAQYRKLYKFGDTGTVSSPNDAVFNETDGFWYIYKLDSFPAAIPAAPDSNWINVGLLTGFPVNSVLNYGADNVFGVVDSSDAFDLCFTAAAARWSSPRWGWEIGGSVVDVPAGFYKLTRPILLQRGVWVKGAGISRTVIYADTVEPTADGAAVFYVKRYTGSGDTTYENNNITVDGLDIYCSSDIDGINLDTAPFKSRVVNCGVRNAKNGISIYKSHTADVTDCLIDTCTGWGIYGYANHNSVISKNRIHRCKTCVRIEGGSAILVIRENVFQWSDEHAVRITDVISSLSIENNYFEWCCRSMNPSLRDSTSYVFVDATYNDSVNMPVINIRGNSIQISFKQEDGFTASVGNGIRVTHGKCVNICDNYIGYTSATEYGPIRGIWIGGSVVKCKISGNYINSANLAILSQTTSGKLVELANTVISGARSFNGAALNLDEAISNTEGGFLLNLTTSQPVNPKVGSSYFSISAGKPLYWNGTSWRDSMGNIAN